MRIIFQYISISAFLSLLILHGCSSSVTGTKTPENPGPYDFVILHYNDFHSQNVPWIPTNANPDRMKIGGYANLDAMMDSIETIYDVTLRFNAGDDFQGTPVSSMSKGKSQIEIMNAVGLDFFTIGNHEFDYGWKNIQQLLPMTEFDIYAANLFIENGETPLEDLRIFEFYGKKMAVIGLTTASLSNLTLSKNIKGLRVEEPARTAKRIISELKKDGIEFIVAVTHQGLDQDIKLAKAVPGLDLIIGGHSHSYVPIEKIVGKTRIVQTGSKGRNLGIIKLTEARGDIATFDYMLQQVEADKIKASPDVQAIVDKYEIMAGDELEVVIGVLKQDWDRGGLVSNIGIWQCEAMMAAAEADIAFQNNGGIRKDLPAGEITSRDIWEIAPFANTLTTFEVTGSELLDMINYMIREYRFRSMQSGGIRLHVDSGSQQILEFTVGGSPVDPGRTYKVVTNNYVADRMGRNFGLEGHPVINIGLVDRDVFIEAVKEQKFIDVSPDDRVKFK